jgi:anti-sigma B factor antagonist
MWLTCWLDWDGEATIVHIRGKIDAFTSATLRQCLKTAMMDSRTQVVLDLSEVTFIDENGLRILDRFRQDCQDQGLPFALTRVPPYIRHLLERVDLDRVLPILNSTYAKQGAASTRKMSGTRHTG